MHWIYLSFACTLFFSFSYYSLGLSAWTPKEQPQTPWNATKRFKTRLYRHQNGKQNEIVTITDAQQWLYLNFTKWRSNCLQKRIWCEIRWRLLLTLSNLSIWFGAIHAPFCAPCTRWFSGFVSITQTNFQRFILVRICFLSESLEKRFGIPHFRKRRAREKSILTDKRTAEELIALLGVEVGGFDDEPAVIVCKQEQDAFAIFERAHTRNVCIENAQIKHDSAHLITLERRTKHEKSVKHKAKNWYAYWHTYL